VQQQQRKYCVNFFKSTTSTFIERIILNIIKLFAFWKSVSFWQQGFILKNIQQFFHCSVDWRSLCGWVVMVTDFKLLAPHWCGSKPYLWCRILNRRKMSSWLTGQWFCTSAYPFRKQFQIGTYLHQKLEKLPYDLNPTKTKQNQLRDIYLAVLHLINALFLICFFQFRTFETIESVFKYFEDSIIQRSCQKCNIVHRKF